MKYNNKQNHKEEVEKSKNDTQKKERSPRLGNSPEGVEAVDLGMPSGTKWASCNVGATKPEECGGYYAWGETEEKVNYTDVTYLYSRGEDIDLDGEYEEKERYKYLGPDISGTQYDVAHVKWGGDWRMPTLQQFKELLANCTSQWTSLNGKIGCKFISKINGSSIFFPAYRYLWGSEWEELRFEQIMKFLSANGIKGTPIGDFFRFNGPNGVICLPSYGYCWGGKYNNHASSDNHQRNSKHTVGYYWSSTQNPLYDDYAYDLRFHSGYSGWEGNYRSFGQCVRPVITL